MPVAKGAFASYIIQNIQDLVNNHNQLYSIYVHDYKCFTRERTRLSAINNSFVKLLNDPRFSDKLHDILTKFGMNATSSRL
jgi:hypothetical protein